MLKTLRCNPQLFEKDLEGKTFLVTGANAGVGLETTRQLVRQGAHVVMACRRVEAGQQAASTMTKEKGSTEVMPLDLGDLNSVRAFAAAFLDKYNHLDGLINNAGVVNFSLSRTKDGFEEMFGINHLGHFLLTELLLDLLKSSAPSRIVILSSVVHAGSSEKRVTVDLNDPNFENRPFEEAYGQSKLANLLHAKQLAQRLEGSGVTAVSVHPGWARSNLIGTTWTMQFLQNVLLRPFAGLLGMMNNYDGAQTSLHCILDDSIPEHNGEYFSQNSILYADKECRPGGWPMRSPNENAHDMALASKLDQLSRQLVNLQQNPVEDSK